MTSSQRQPHSTSSAFILFTHAKMKIRTSIIIMLSIFASSWTDAFLVIPLPNKLVHFNAYSNNNNVDRNFSVLSGCGNSIKTQNSNGVINLQKTDLTLFKQRQLKRQQLQNTRRTSTELSAMPFFHWFQKKEDDDDEDSFLNNYNMNELTIQELKNASKNKRDNANRNNNGEVEAVDNTILQKMQRTTKMMQDHRRAQEASERTASIMEELSTILVVGKSKAGSSSSSFSSSGSSSLGGIIGLAEVVGGGVGGGGGGGGGDNVPRRGGVQVTFNGQRRPISVKIDPNFLFSTGESGGGGEGDGGSSSGGDNMGIRSIEELNEAVTDAMVHGYELSGKVMEEKMKDLYEQLGLPREPPSFTSK